MSLPFDIVAPLIGLLLAVAGLFGFGRSQRAKGKREAAAEAHKARLDGMKQAQEAQDEVQGMDDVRVGDELTKWVRDKRNR